MYDRPTIIHLSRTIIRLSLPVLVEQFFIVLMGAVSTMLVGNLGREAVSAVGNIDTINNVMISVFSSVAIGGTVLVAQFTGREDRLSASRAASQAMLASIVLALVLTVLVAGYQHTLVDLLFGRTEVLVRQNSLSYLSIVVWSYPPLALATTAFGVLRGNGNMKAPMSISIVMNLANIFLSSILIYGFRLDLGFIKWATPAYGVAGAAWGLTLARVLGFALAIVMLKRSDLAFSWAPRRFLAVDRKKMGTILFLGVPAGFEQLMFNGGKLIVQMFIVSLGTVALAANAICSSIAAFATMPTVAMSLALTTIVGQAIGRRDKEGARTLLTFAIPFCSAILVGMSLLFLPVIGPVIGLYTQDPATRQAALPIMILYLIAQPMFWPSSFALAAGFRGAGDVRYQLVVTMVSMWVLRIGLGYLLTAVFSIGVIGVWIAMISDWALRSLLFILRLRSGKWLHKDLAA
ncbi:MAG: MATE family efflux transporter [Eubacteriales bacterium]|nr:MATE family efflux transporter [Eubacteriales bacterium]